MEKSILEKADEILKQRELKAIIFKVGRYYQKATAKEIVENNIPTSAEEIIFLKENGKREMFFIDPLGR